MTTSELYPEGGSAASWWELTWVGTGGYRSPLSRGMPAALLSIGTQRHLINVGDGTLGQLFRLRGARRPQAIWLTSCESECSSGLIALLEYFAGIGTLALPLIRGPRGTQELMTTILASATADLERVEVVELAHEDVVELGGERVAVYEIGNDPDRPALGYRIAETDWPGALDPEKAIELGIEPGPKFGRLKRGETVDGVAPEDVVAKARPGRKVAISWAGRPSARLASLIDGVQLWGCSATYIDEKLGVAVDSDRCTGLEAAALAAERGVGSLALVQVSAHTPPSYARAEAAQLYPTVKVPNDGDRYLIPLPDTGGVTVDRWSPRAAPRGR
jgi:ribonuclease Z